MAAPQRPAFCHQCGTRLAPDDVFCGSCGTAIDTDAKAMPDAVAGARRSSRPGQTPARSGFGMSHLGVSCFLLAALGVLLLVVGGAALFWLVPENEGGGSDPLKEAIADLPERSHEVSADSPRRPVESSLFPYAQRAAQVVSHPSGARVSVPAGPVLYSPKVALREEPRPPELKDVPLLSAVYRFESYAGIVLGGKTPVDLPAGDGGDSAVVMVHSPLGLWIVLPSEPVTLADGKPGRRVLIDSEPTPWTLVAARGRAGGAESARGSISFLERLRWTDKRALKRELERSAAAETRDTGRTHESFSFFPAAYAEEKKKDSRTPEELLTAACATLSQSSAIIWWLDHAPESPISPTEGEQAKRTVQAWTEYVKGLRLLRQVRDADDLSGLKVDVGGSLPDGVPESAKVEVLLESMMAYFAPWGIDFTLLLVDNHVLNERFDLRVLEPYGELLFADVDLKLPEQKGEIRGLIKQLDHTLKVVSSKESLNETKCNRRAFLRLHSSRLFLKGWGEWFAEWGEIALRWGPVVTGLYTGGWGVPLAWALTETGLDWYAQAYNVSNDVYARIQYGTTTLDEGSELLISYTANEVFCFGREGPQKVSGWSPKTKASALMYILSCAVASAQVGMRQSYIGEVRRLATGPKGYKRGADGWIFSADQFETPPVLVVAWVHGPLKGTGRCDYPVDGLFFKVWELDYEKLYASDLFTGDGLHGRVRALVSELYDSPVRGSRSTTDPKRFRLNLDIPYELPVKELETDLIASVRKIDSTPKEQFIRFVLPQQTIEAILKQQKRSESWNRVDLSTLGLSVSLTGRQDFGLDREWSMTVPVKEVPTFPKEPLGRACGVHLVAGTFEPTADEEVEAGYGGSVGQLRNLHTRYTFSLSDKKGVIRKPFELNFLEHQGARMKTGTRSTPGTEMVPWHLLDIGLLSGVVVDTMADLPCMYPGSYTLRTSGFEVGGQRIIMGDWDVDIDAAGVVKMSYGRKVKNVTLTGSGTVLRKSAGRKGSSSDYTWDVRFKYTYEDMSGQGGSFQVEGTFNGTKLNGTVTRGASAVPFSNVSAMLAGKTP